MSTLLAAAMAASVESWDIQKAPEISYTPAQMRVIDTANLTQELLGGVVWETSFKDEGWFDVADISIGADWVVQVPFDIASVDIPVTGSNPDGDIYMKDGEVIEYDEVVPKEIMFTAAKELPSVDDLISAHPEIKSQYVKWFSEDFESLGHAKPRYVPDFYTLAPSERSFMFQIYASAIWWLTEESDRKRLVKYSIWIPDVSENLRYIIENEWDIRDGDPLDVMDKVKRAIEKFPDIQSVLTLELFEEMETLQLNAVATIYQRGRMISEDLNESEERLIENEKRRKKLDASYDEIEKNLKFLRELRRTLFPKEIASAE